MVGIRKGSTAWMQRNVGRFHNAAKRIHEKSPEMDDDLREMISQYGDMVDNALMSEPVKPMKNVLCDRIFGEK